MSKEPDRATVERAATHVVVMRAQAVAGRLALATEQLNEALVQAEAALASLNLGVSAEVLLDEGAQLGFGKMEKNGGWQLYVQLSGQRVALRHASRRNRLLASGKLDELLDALLEQVGKELEATEVAIGLAQAFPMRLPSVG